jgi:hypothetical protein
MLGKTTKGCDGSRTKMQVKFFGQLVVGQLRPTRKVADGLFGLNDKRRPARLSARRKADAADR